MDPAVLALLAGLAGAVLGAVLASVLSRGRIEAVGATARAAGAEELARATERVRALETELARRGDELARAQTDRDQLRGQLADSRERLAGATARASQVEELQAQLGTSRGREQQLDQERSALAAKLEAESKAHLETRASLDAMSRLREAAETKNAQLLSANEGLLAKLEEQQKSAEEKLELLRQAKDELGERFKNLANEILEEKSKRFLEHNQQNVGQLLEPLKTQLTEFKTKVEEVYVNESKDRSALKQQVEQLLGMNDRLSKDAQSLAEALRGSSKTQGNWGELVLERILESAGLREGMEYDLQESHKRDDGSRVQPDVTLHLPQERHLILDSKVSLLAYQDAVSAADEASRATAVRAHLESLRAHIKGLSAKNYQELYRLRSIDFVVMFVPVEPAYMLALQEEPQLWHEAWEKNVLLVSPSTLLFVVRTVAYLWRQEAQQRNAQEIAKRGAELYDKLVGFTVELEKVGEKLQAAQDAFSEARNKLAVGRGNVIRRAEQLKELGVKPTKSLPAGLVEGAAADPASLLEAPTSSSADVRRALDLSLPAEDGAG